MAKAINARSQGDDYQARWFWIQVTRLFSPYHRVTKVGWEVEGVSGFDDVVVYYDGEHGSGETPLVRADYYQVKFHVTQEKAFTISALIDPEFVGGTSRSLLQRLAELHGLLGPAAAESRFTIVSPVVVDPNDPLAGLLDSSDGSIRLDRLSKGQTHLSAMGRVRKSWRDHLGLSNDSELFAILRTLRIRQNSGFSEDLRDSLNDRFASLGFKPHSAGQLSTAYDDLPKKLAQRGQNVFDKAAIEQLMTRERLRTPRRSVRPAEARQIGVRSFFRWAEYMEDETESMLSLMEYFDHRSILDQSLWSSAVLPKLVSWLQDATLGATDVDIHLDAHASVAFGAGWLSPRKSGMSLRPVQRTRTGKKVWRPDGSKKHNSELWMSKSYDLRPEASDIAVVLNVTHRAGDDVHSFLNSSRADIHRVLELTPVDGIGHEVVKSGSHAAALAEQAVRLGQGSLLSMPRSASVHLFASAPNGLMFFLGQMAHAWARCAVYEFDFEKTNDMPYSLSLSLTNQSR